jgi:hypothetical protein
MDNTNANSRQKRVAIDQHYLELLRGSNRIMFITPEIQTAIDYSNTIYPISPVILGLLSRLRSIFAHRSSYHIHNYDTIRQVIDLHNAGMKIGDGLHLYYRVLHRTPSPPCNYNNLVRMLLEKRLHYKMDGEEELELNLPDIVIPYDFLNYIGKRIDISCFTARTVQSILDNDMDLMWVTKNDDSICASHENFLMRALKANLSSECIKLLIDRIPSEFRQEILNMCLSSNVNKLSDSRLGNIILLLDSGADFDDNVRIKMLLDIVTSRITNASSWWQFIRYLMRHNKCVRIDIRYFFSDIDIQPSYIVFPLEELQWLILNVPEDCIDEYRDALTLQTTNFKKNVPSARRILFLNDLLKYLNGRCFTNDPSKKPLVFDRSHLIDEMKKRFKDKRVCNHYKELIQIAIDLESNIPIPVLKYHLFLTKTDVIALRELLKIRSYTDTAVSLLPRELVHHIASYMFFF